MDQQAFAQLLGNYGEFVGAIAVVVTLAYLAAQIRQNTKAIEVSNLRSRTDRNIGHSRFAVSTPGLISIYTRGQRDPSQLNEEEYALFGTYMHSIMLDSQEYHQLYIRSGIDSPFQSRAAMDKGLLAQLARPGGRHWWKTSRVKEEYESDFVAYIDQLIQSSRP